jgi:alpha-glucosidase (family GH31 glycosyl hydrolase)
LEHCPGIVDEHCRVGGQRCGGRDRAGIGDVEGYSGDPAVVDVFRRYAQLRTRLKPYLVEQARLSVRTARPLLRGLFVDHPHDERVWDFPRQFQMGDDILVSPVTEPGVAQWAVYLPEGEWVDAWDGTAHAGRQVVTRDVPRDVVPVFLRADAAPRLRPVFVV